MNIINLKTADFENEVLNSNQKVLIDFFATWCGPCKMLSPIIEQIAEETNGKIKVCKVNIDEELDLATKYGIMSVPTLLVLENGQIVNQSVGLKSKEEILELLKV